MALASVQASLERPDFYLDWEARTRVSLRQGPASVPWCSVQIVALPDIHGSCLPNLRRLANAIKGDVQDGGSAKPDEYAIRASADEERHLNDLIEKISKGKITQPTESQMELFVYLPERLLYENGTVAQSEIYKIINIGPPIDSLAFDARRGQPEPTEFPHSVLTSKDRVAIGIIDDGIAFAHERFRHSKGGSRIQAIWLQDVEHAEASGRVAFGQRLDNREINRLLTQSKSETEIYRRAGLLDFKSSRHKTLAYRASHGTHVLDLASGFDPALRTRGIDDPRPIFAVQLPSPVTGDTSGVTMGSYVLQAVRQIMLWADAFEPGIPLVINFSYGILAGPKDGEHDLERALSRLIDGRNATGAPTSLVLPAGNSFRMNATARMDLAEQAIESVNWVVLPDDHTQSFLEIWLDADEIPSQHAPVELTITPPGAKAGFKVRASSGKVHLLEQDGAAILGVYYSRVTHGGSARGRLALALNPTAFSARRVARARAGHWQLTLKNVSPNRIAAYLGIQRDDTLDGYAPRGRQSFFDHANAYGRDRTTGNYSRLQTEKGCPITTEGTLSAIATGARSIVVGAASETSPPSPSGYTSAGPTVARDGPDCAAIADEGAAYPGILAAGTRSGSVVALRGTSVAAPQVVRVLADTLSSQTCVVDWAGTLMNSRQAETVISRDAVSTVDVNDRRRLGLFIVPRPKNLRIPKRRYPPK